MVSVSTLQELGFLVETRLTMDTSLSFPFRPFPGSTVDDECLVVEPVGREGQGRV